MGTHMKTTMLYLDYISHHEKMLHVNKYTVKDI